MKRIICSVFFILGFYAVNSQNYVAFPTDTAHWNNLYWWNGSPTLQWYRNYTYTMDGDTAIQGKLYEKMYYKDVDDLINPRKYIGGLREDSIKRIFFFPFEAYLPTPSIHHFPNNTSEHLLYTFNDLHIGDSLPINTAFTTIRVVGIDSVMIGGNYRKRYEVYNNKMLFQPEYWIEGIGSTKEFLSPFTEEFEWEFFTLCFGDPDNYYINAPGGADSCHFTYSGIDGYELLSRQMKLYPSPASEKITVEWDGVVQDFQFSLFNAYGELYFQQSVIQPKIEINISSIPQGLYFIKLNTTEGSVVKRFVKE